MNIYFVNRYSKLKGPFDIIDSNREHIIKVGDVCLRDTTGGIEFLFITTQNNSWNACKCVGLGRNDVFASKGNSLLLSFDGIHGRKGDLTFLTQLTSCFSEIVINDFIENAIDILEYKRDSWDGGIFPRFFAENIELVVKKELPPSSTPKSESYPSVFSKYLNDSLLDLLKTYINEGLSLKDAYMFIREKDSEAFRKALLKFLEENPNGTIFDKTPDTDNRAVPEPEVDTKVDIKKPEKEIIQEERKVDEFRRFLINDFDNKEFRKLLKEYHKGDNKAFEKIVKGNMKLVTAIAESYKDNGVEYNDLVQEGTIGLIRAIERFDPRRKVQFPVYAKWWIHQALIGALGSIKPVVKIPANLYGLYKKVRKSIDQYEQEHEFSPAPSEIEIDGCDDYQSIEYLSSLPDSLDKLTTNDADFDTIPNAELSADDILMKESQSIYIDEILNKLTHREALILRLKYGIGERMETMSEIGNMMALTRERVRQISEKAVRKLRDILVLHKKNDEDSSGEKEHVIENVNTHSVQSSINYNGYRIDNTSRACNVYDPNGIRFFHSEGNIVKLDENLCLVIRKSTYIKINRVDVYGLKLNIGRTLIHADLRSDLYGVIGDKNIGNQINELKRDRISEGYYVCVKGNWYNVLGSHVTFPPSEKEVKTKEKNYKKEIASPSKSNNKGAEVGNIILYSSKKCVVLDKKTSTKGLRLIVKYENGTIDNVIDDINRYQILKQTGEIIDNKRKNTIAKKENGVKENGDGDASVKKVQPVRTSKDSDVEDVYVGVPSVDSYFDVEDGPEFEVEEIVGEEPNKIIEFEPEPETAGEPELDSEIGFNKIKTIFDKKASSYKYFWFLSIISLAKEHDVLAITYKGIVARMAAMAWPLVFKYGISLGKSDMMASYLSLVEKATKLVPSTSSIGVESYIKKYYEFECIDRVLAPLLKNVPYRFLSPWVKYTTDQEVIAASNEKNFTGMYALLDDRILLNEDWWDYILDHYNELCRFATQSFLDYAKQYNDAMKLQRFRAAGFSFIGKP